MPFTAPEAIAPNANLRLLCTVSRITFSRYCAHRPKQSIKSELYPSPLQVMAPRGRAFSELVAMLDILICINRAILKSAASINQSARELHCQLRLDRSDLRNRLSVKAA
jgi:hypothetical protein